MIALMAAREAGMVIEVDDRADREADDGVRTRREAHVRQPQPSDLDEERKRLAAERRILRAGRQAKGFKS
jgi:hypothetical protein